MYKKLSGLNTRWRTLLVPAALLAVVQNVQAGDLSVDDLWQLSVAALGEIKVTSLASGTPNPLDKAAAIATVITAADIAAMGATDLDQVLETVPGLHVGRSDQVFFPKYNIRGITSTFNPQTLVLINGIPITSLFVGNRSQAWVGMPVKSIARVEVIRGPGSALYGADAFSGVINIVTKSAQDIDGVTVGMRGGSFDTQAGWLEYSAHLGEFKLGFTLEYETTDGWQEKVQEDAQTGLDTLYGSNASLAPGSVNTMKDLTESRLDLRFHNSILRMGYQGGSNIGTGPGLAQALDDDGRFGSERLNVDYSYTLDELSPDWGIKTRISYYHGTQTVEENVKIFPDGAFGGAYPDGLIGNPEYKEENARIDLSSVYRGVEGHIVRLGVGGYWGDIYEVTETKNFNSDFSPKPGLEDVSDTDEVYLPEKDRTSYYAFGQDEWQLAEQWQLTTGVRLDRYSDIGETINPRLALVWAATSEITAKALYGRAFRAPAIVELFATSNPVTLGNPDLTPETIDTYELALFQNLSSRLNYSANLFYYQIEDYITFVSAGAETRRAQNVGERTGYGAEVEVEYKPADSLRLLANYAYQKSKDDATHADVGDAPNAQIYARTEWRFSDGWHLNTQVNWVGKQLRVKGDPRSAVEDYTTVDIVLNARRILQGVDLTFSVRNLFDEKVYEPSPGPIPSMAGDFPMAGRSVYGELSYTF